MLSVDGGQFGSPSHHNSVRIHLLQIYIPVLPPPDRHQPVLLLASSEEIVLRVTDLSEGRHEEGGGLEIFGLENIEPDVHLSVRLLYVVSARGSFA